MTTNADYIKKFILETNLESYLDKVNEQAFKNIQKPFFLKPIKPKTEEELNIENRIATNNITSLAINDENTNIQILEHLKANNMVSDFNKNFQLFKKIVANKRISSLGEFIQLYDNFKSNIASNTENIIKTGLIPESQTTKDLADIKRDLDISENIDKTKLELDTLTKMPKTELDELFKVAVMKDKLMPIAVNQTIDIPHGSKYGDVYLSTIRGIDPIRLSVSTREQLDPTLSKSMIRYILSVNGKYNRSVQKLLQASDIIRTAPVGTGLLEDFKSYKNRMKGRGRGFVGAKKKFWKI